MNLENITIKIEVDTTELDEALEKIKMLKEKLEVMTKRKDRLMDNLKCTLDEIDDEN